MSPAINSASESPPRLAARRAGAVGVFWAAGRGGLFSACHSHSRRCFDLKRGAGVDDVGAAWRGGSVEAVITRAGARTGGVDSSDGRLREEERKTQGDGRRPEPGTGHGAGRGGAMLHESATVTSSKCSDFRDVTLRRGWSAWRRDTVV